MHNSPLTDFVLGFAFAENKHSVVLIKKNGRRFPWMKGKLNGVGGKVELTDPNCVAAMSREFLEETGVLILPEQWKRRGVFMGPGYMVHVFSVFSDRVIDVVTQENEQEQVMLVGVPSLPDLPKTKNVPWLVPLCLCDQVTDFFIAEEP